jgi:hypothetical protein
LPEPRSRYGLTSFEGRLYLFGGWDGSNFCADVFIYDPTTEEWSEGAPLPTPRRNAGAVAVNERVYVIGGENQNGAVKATESFDPTSGNSGGWESVLPLPTAVSVPAVTGMLDTVVVFDPNQHIAAQYMPALDTWESIEIPRSIPISSRVAVLGTSLFVFGYPSSDRDIAASVSEYKIVFTTFLPNVSGSD